MTMHRCGTHCPALIGTKFLFNYKLDMNQQVALHVWLWACVRVGACETGQSSASKSVSRNLSECDVSIAHCQALCQIFSRLCGPSIVDYGWLHGLWENMHASRVSKNKTYIHDMTASVWILIDKVVQFAVVIARVDAVGRHVPYWDKIADSQRVSTS